MNTKKTNYTVSILNLIAIVAVYIFTFLGEPIGDIVVGGWWEKHSVCNSFIVDLLYNNQDLIFIILFSVLSIVNITIGIQNRNEKKLAFSYILFSGFLVFFVLMIKILNELDEDIILSVYKLVFSIVPIIFGIINLICINKSNYKKLHVISYILIIMAAIFSMFDNYGIGMYIWFVLSIAIQMVYTYTQSGPEEESRKTKILNLILYKIIQAIAVVAVLFIVVWAVLVSKITSEIWDKELALLKNEILMMGGFENKEIFIPVSKNEKYGFIDENGKERISCQYDRVSFFGDLNIDGNVYYVALVEKEDRYYIISKNNDAIMLDGNLEKYVNTISEKSYGWFGSLNLKKEECDFWLRALMRGKIKNIQTVDNVELDTITLQEKDSMYLYSGKRYIMMIKLIENENNTNLYDEYNVTIQKKDGTSYSNKEYLPGMDVFWGRAALNVFSDGYIQFRDIDDGRNGIYDSNGNKKYIPDCYDIVDVKDSKFILKREEIPYEYSGETDYMIMDFSNKVLLNTNLLYVHDELYLVKTINDDMVLLDKNLKIISNGYDKIITNEVVKQELWTSGTEDFVHFD